MNKIRPRTILLLAANPSDTARLRLDVEAREIRASLERAKYRDLLSLETRFAVGPQEVRRAILDLNPVLVQFGGHGAGKSGVVLEGAAGRSSLVGTEALSEFFRLFRDGIRCVVLNACFSVIQARVIARHVDYVVGMETGTTDDSARRYSVAFYDALGNTLDVPRAHEIASNALRWERKEEGQQLPKLYAREGANPELLDQEKIDHGSGTPSKARSIPEHHFAAKGYEQLRDKFCEYMLGHLDQYDADLSWSDRNYTRLEAEIEIDRRGLRKPRVERDLVRAIRRKINTRTFLLLGDPGSGKSVSLRRLCRQLYSDVPRTGIVPIYVNLREWNDPVDPREELIPRFLFDYLWEATGQAGKGFLRQWFQPMLQNGRFFFLLDSFDEMPAVLDCDDLSPRIQKISRAFDRFFNDLHDCRGVLASRRYRQPRGFRAQRLSVRPLKQRQIRQAMASWLSGTPLDPKRIVQDLFRTRPDLVPVIRNPFLADLTAQYLIYHDGALPPSQFAIYDSFLAQRLDDYQAYLAEEGLEPVQVLEGATQVARSMYCDTNAGLEARAEDVSEWLDSSTDPEAIIQALCSLQLIRMGRNPERYISFIHRRFAEFFVVRSMTQDSQELPLDAIPEDSRWRDCLVVYCGVASEKDVRQVARFCTYRIYEGLDREDVRELRPVIHCLRFLRDAFLARSQCLDDFRSLLDLVVIHWLLRPELLIQKLSVECLGIVSPKARALGIQRAFDSRSDWLKETALVACRQLSTLEKTTLQSIRAYVRQLPTPRILKEYRELTFTLGLSEALRFQLLALRLDLLWLAALWFLLIPLFLWQFGSLGLEPARDFILYLVTFAGLLEFLIRQGKIGGRRGFETALRYGLPFAVMSTLTFSEKVPYTLFVGKSAYVYLLLAASLPWDVLSRLWKATRELIDILRILNSLEARSPWRHLTGCSPWLLVVPGVWLLPKEVAAVFPCLSLVVVAVYGVLFVGWLSRKAYSVVDGTRHSLQDEAFLHGLRIGETVTYSWVYRSLAKLQTNSNRQRLLEVLRLRQVGVSGDRIPLPEEEDWVDDGVREGMARLESLWLGLEE